MALQDIQETIDRATRDPVRQVCLRLIDRLAAISPDQLQRLTFTILADFAGTSPEADELHAALTTLTTMKFSPLKLYFVFYDAGDDSEIAIPASDVMQSVDEGVSRQNIWRNSRRKLAECGPRLGVDVTRRACGAASADVRWSVA